MLLADVALRREASPFLFPPQLKFADAQKNLRKGQVVLSFLATDQGVYSFLMTKENYAFQQLTDPRKVKLHVTDLLRKLGHLDPNNQLSAETFADDSWKVPATELMSLLLPKANDGFWRTTDELVIVPDGILWYLPFEILQLKATGEAKAAEKDVDAEVDADAKAADVKAADAKVPDAKDADAKTESLFAKTKIRYAPTVALALNDASPIKTTGNSAVVTGKLYVRDELDVSATAFEDLKKNLPRAVKVPFRLPGTSDVLSSICDELIVWDDIDESGKSGPYDWSPLQIDRGKPASSLNAWMSLPQAGPQQIYLPGFHTNAATGLKGKANGDEVFLTTCGLMASGAKTILLSRWRVGGDSAYRLTDYFARQFPQQGAANAWRDSVEEFQLGELKPAAEPRIKKSQTIEKIDPNHPFFWAGYMLIDTGRLPAK
jgi:hypothetical protein